MIEITYIETTNTFIIRLPDHSPIPSNSDRHGAYAVFLTKAEHLALLDGLEHGVTFKYDNAPCASFKISIDDIGSCTMRLQYPDGYVVQSCMNDSRRQAFIQYVEKWMRE